ncbi:MAG: DUF5677 domain-containing protein [Anaerolineales bacterium]
MENYQALISAFKKRIEHCEVHIVNFEKRHDNHKREDALIYCLRHAVDLAKGCLVTADAKLPDSLKTQSRALLETFFWARYVAASEANAQEFIDSTINEMKRVARMNVKAGYATVYDKKTTKEKTKEYLNSPLANDIPNRISIRKTAELGGLGRLYSILYGYMSMISHGRAIGMVSRRDIDRDFYASMSTAIGALQGIEMVAADWVIGRKQTDADILSKMLGIQVDP